MPIISKSNYNPPFIFKNAHINTIYPALLRKVTGVHYERERIHTPDEDFFDIDWAKVQSNKLVVLMHGLEGMADRHYIRGMAKVFNSNNWDAVGINCRGCSGETNLKPYSYHMGWTKDLDQLLNIIVERDQYSEIVLVGFSMGGNMILKYLGEQANKVPKLVKKAVAISVPCDITSANVSINHWQNGLYLFRFMRTLNRKVIEKGERHPELLVFQKGNLPKRFNEFDEKVTAPVNGFASAEDYWKKNSSLQFFPEIQIPTLLINAKDDTFLSPECFPFAFADKSKTFYLETPDYGGHCGFTSLNKTGTFWSEKRALEFCIN